MMRTIIRECIVLNLITELSIIKNIYNEPKTISQFVYIRFISTCIQDKGTRLVLLWKITRTHTTVPFTNIVWKVRKSVS